MLPIHDFLLTVIRARVNDAGWEWLVKARQHAAGGTVDELLAAYTGSGMRVGRAALSLRDDERLRADELAPGLDLSLWTLADAARAVLLIGRANRSDKDSFCDAAVACYEQGDAAEQTSWLRALTLLPDPDRFTMVAIDACRTSIQTLFEAVACENPFPARWFPDANFNQLVLKSLFNTISLARVVSLVSRLNDDLARMADDYVTEREAAGRFVPADIWLVLAPRIGADRLGRVARYLEHDDPAHRYWAAVGLGLRPSADGRGLLERRRGIETDTRTQQAIADALARLDRLEKTEPRL